MPKTKPLLFLLQKQAGTVGDHKPFCILAAIAASVSVYPVTLYCNGFGSAPKFMRAVTKFAIYLMGPKYYKQFHINYVEDTKVYDDDFWDNLESKFCIFDNYDCDFGASVQRATNRFKTKMFPYRAKLLKNGDWTMVSADVKEFFGPVMLPLEKDIFWSKTRIINELHNFRTHHDKIIAIAGSLSSPYPMDEITEWIRSNNDEDSWAFVILDPLSMHENPDSQNVLMLKYVEFEDLVRFVDVFIGNCGAGSTMTAMAAGLVQTCQIAGSVGADKTFNRSTLAKLGPLSSTFDQVMLNLETHFTIYQKRAIRTKFRIHNETKQMVRNMQTFFYDLSSSFNMQKIFTDTRKIPFDYALE